MQTHGVGGDGEGAIGRKVSLEGLENVGVRAQGTQYAFGKPLSGSWIRCEEGGGPQVAKQEDPTSAP
jgi:hypothetical protein